MPKKCKSCGKDYEHKYSSLCAECYNGIEDLHGGHLAVANAKEARNWARWAKRQNDEAGARLYNQ